MADSDTEYEAEGAEITFEQALAERHRSMQAYAYACCHDLELAEVIVRGACLAALENADAYDPETDFEEWVFGIVRHRWEEERNVRGLPDRATAYVHDHAAILFVPQLYGDDVWSIEKQAVATTLRQLDGTDQLILNSLVEKGETYDRIAKRLNLSPEKLKVRLGRTRNAFRRYLDESLEESQ